MSNTRLGKRARFRPEHKPRRASLPSLPAERCPKCTRLLDEVKYHDCGEQAELFDVERYRRPG